MLHNIKENQSYLTQNVFRATYEFPEQNSPWTLWRLKQSDRLSGDRLFIWVHFTPDTDNLEELSHQAG